MIKIVTGEPVYCQIETKLRTTGMLSVKNDDKIASSEHLHCSVFILFLTRPSNVSKDTSKCIITANSDFKNDHQAINKKNVSTHVVSKTPHPLITL
jgi:hypothetical protein